MNEHLSPEDISRWFAGERTPELHRHAGECEACSARLDRMESAIEEFRGSVHDWSAEQSPPAPRIAWALPVRHLARTWILAAASLLILASGPAYWHFRQQARAAEAARADALLQQVDAEISRAVPQTMEPLVSLVTWGSGPTEESQTKEMQ
jgi:anti-sigma factor RsiW